MKNLPLAMQSEINCYFFYASPYSILCAYPEYRDYLAECYMQCYGYVVDNLSHMTFAYADGIGYNDVTYCTGPLDIAYLPYNAGIQIEIKKYVTDAIDNDTYVNIFTDEYYIEGRSACQKQHRLHDILIFGHDGDRFHYLTFDRRAYTSSFPRDTIDEAYKSGHSMDKHTEPDQKTEWLGERSIVLMKPKKIQKPYIFSPVRFAENLKLYSRGQFESSYDSFVIPREKCHAGVYNTDIIKYCLNSHEKKIYILYPAIHAWYESKRNLLGKIKYCYEKLGAAESRLLDEYESKVKKQADKVRLSFIRLDRSGNLNIEATNALLTGIADSEAEIIGGICGELAELV